LIELTYVHLIILNLLL